MTKSALHKKWVTLSMSQKVTTLHCQQCNTIVSDSFGICGDFKPLDSIMCQGITKNVVICGSTVGDTSGMNNCIYNPLKCAKCHLLLGAVIKSTPPKADLICSIFLLYKSKLNCYTTGGKSLMKANTMCFDKKPLQESVDEVRQLLTEQMGHMLEIEDKLNGMVAKGKSK